MRKFFLLPLLLCLFTTTAFAQVAKKQPLNHNVYEEWERLSAAQISNNGALILYEINPAKGDGDLYIDNELGKNLKQVPRGTKGWCSFSGKTVVYQVTQYYDSLRNEKLEKVKKEQRVKDTLAIYTVETDSTLLFPNVTSYKHPRKKESLIAFIEHLEKSEKVDDTTNIAQDSLAKKKKKKEEIKRLHLYRDNQPLFSPIENVDHYLFSTSGEQFCFSTKFGDTIDSIGIFVYDCHKMELYPIFEGIGEIEKPTLSSKGNQLSFMFTSDTTEIKKYALYLYDIKKEKQPTVIIDTNTTLFDKGYVLSTHYSPRFTEDEENLYFGIGKEAEEKEEDTLLATEKAVVDVWSWQDEYLQPQQLLRVDKKKNQTYLAIWNIPHHTFLQLENEELEQVSLLNKEATTYTIGRDDRSYRKESSWDTWYSDFYIINHTNGKRRQFLTKSSSRPTLSPEGEWCAWFDKKEQYWWGMNTSSLEKKNLTATLDIPFYNQDHDMPVDPGSYGVAGWLSDGKLLVYDQYDIWALDLSGKKPPTCITKGEGRKNNIEFRYIKTDADLQYIPYEFPIYLTAFHTKTKEKGYYQLTIEEEALQQLILAKSDIFGLKKAKEANKLIWRKGDFQHYPELYSSDLTFKDNITHSNTNPQQEHYKWGTSELISWCNFNGDIREGLLYKPEDFNPEKSYPVIVYFYERNDRNLYRHYGVSPSRSVINIPLYVSNDYLVFVPNIRYKEGFPGKCAYDDIVSGALFVGSQPWADSKKMGIQGQSWGGYQVAYLVTQTNLFAAAEAGAPVSNMTSAYGGIRWASGMSRMFQYENTQSRIGGTLWEKPLHYLQNSPVFMAESVETPLLMMHNDNDGAVPWYQSIEFFVALRRLNKPAWLLNYNGDSHNLQAKNWGNRVDLSIRLSQFFDYYLKGAPMPLWMKEGVPATEKGKKTGRALLD